MVERSAVNRNVGSSNLPRGAISQIRIEAVPSFCVLKRVLLPAFR
jgi:hypothetical protein